MQSLPTNPKTLIAFDLESALTTGQASVDFYRPDFRVISCAVSWFDDSNTIQNVYVEGEDQIGLLLLHFHNQQNPIIVHNLSFEYGVLLYRFPEIKLNWHADTMRLTQLADGGKLGLGLQSCIARYLPVQHHNHKEPYYKYLREVGKVKKGKEGANLHLLPPDMLKAYNVADTDTTLLLYQTLAKMFKDINYDWGMDHYLYSQTAFLLSQSRGRGVLVAREKLEPSKASLAQELAELNQAFRDKFSSQIDEIEYENLVKYINARKSEKGQAKAWLDALEKPKLVSFKTSSTHHKERLFCQKLQIKPAFTTPSGKPSFTKKLLRQWGEGGHMLKKRGTIFQALSQVKRLQEFSEYDGRWHIDLKAAGTVTGRLAGAGKLNVQAMARKEERLMGNIIADPGHVFVSIDLSAGEPSIITHFSQDPYYRAAIFDMVGKEPYYDASGVLMIDDIYLMGMSISPMGKDRLRDVFQNHKFDGLSFAQAWTKDPEIIKAFLKAERAFHKVLILGIGYAMGPSKMTLEAFQEGFQLDLQDARKFFKSYWKLIGKVQGLSDNLTERATETGYLINPFGFRCVPDPMYKSLNYFIQSSINGLISCLCVKFFDVCQDAKFITIIHDEVILQIPEDKVQEAKALMQKAVESLNEDLGWSVKIRTGWAPGKDMYTAK